MITPGAGYQVDPNNSNAVIPISGYNPNNPNANAQAPAPQPAAMAPASPAPQMSTPAAPVININNTQQPSVPQSQPTPQQSSPTQNTSQNTSQSSGSPPSTNLQPGSTGQDVQQLQNYLVQMGYLTPEQLSTGPGTYGPQTTAAVAQLQNSLGLQPSSGAGYYGPQTQNALAQKYQGIFNAVQGSQTPDTGAQAQQATQSSLDQQAAMANNPVFGSLSSMMGPIMQSLTQVLGNINNPALSAVSLQSEYNDLREQYQLPEMNASLMNMQNIMNGTETDIRDEVTKTGGFATDSQVLGIAAGRNKVIMKQFNALSTQYDAAQQNVQAMMQYAQTDVSNQMQRQQLSASVTESLASISNQMLNMGMTMQNNARSAVQYNVTQMGYQSLAQSAQGNPQVLGYYENMLGLAPGTLSDPTTVAGMDTYKNQQMIINQYRAAAQGYNVGYQSPTFNSPASFSPTTSTGQYGTATSTVSQITGYDPNISLSQIDPAKLVPAMIQNEGSSPKGVVNNPGNIKYVGLPGQTNSGVQASDGGTFASYSSAAAGQKAIQDNIASAIAKNPNQTLGAFVDRYTNTAPQYNAVAQFGGNGSQLFGQVGTTPVDVSTLVRPPFLSNGVPLTLSADQMTAYMDKQKAATVDPGTNNVVAPGIGYYQQQSDGSYVLKSALPSPTDAQYNSIKQTIANAPPFSSSPKVTSQWTTATNKELSAFKELGTYKVLSTVAPYMANIRAAQTNPGSISDLELIDSYVRLSKGGTGQVTGDQVDIALRGAGFADKAAVLEQKMQNGGVFSTNQRAQLTQLASQVYNENASDYKKLYVEAVKGLQNQGIPVPFWANLPDLNSLLSSNQ